MQLWGPLPPIVGPYLPCILSIIGGEGIPLTTCCCPAYVLSRLHPDEWTPWLLSTFGDAGRVNIRRTVRARTRLCPRGVGQQQKRTRWSQQTAASGRRIPTAWKEEPDRMRAKVEAGAMINALQAGSARPPPAWAMGKPAGRNAVGSCYRVFVPLLRFDLLTRAGWISGLCDHVHRKCKNDKWFRVCLRVAE